MIVTLLVSCLITKSLESCPEDFCLQNDRGSTEESRGVLLGEDEDSGCVCRRVPGVFEFCYSRETCRNFPRSFNFITKTFVLKSSQVREIKPGDLVKVNHVETLKIEGIYNLTLVAKGSFEDLNNLQTLSISHNINLNRLEEGTFNGLVNLKRLFLVKNGFLRLGGVTAALTNLPHLEKLDLSENNFQKVGKNDFEVLRGSKLQELNLVLCQLEDIHKEALNPLTNLRALRLGENKYSPSTIAAVIEETTTKVPLDLLNLYSIALKKNTSKKLLEAVARTNITKLCLAKNQFEVIDSQMFPSMPNLEILDLREVLALNITSDAFVGLPKLKTLLLNGNKLASIPEGALLPQLKKLDLQQNSGSFSSSYFTVYGKKFTNMKSLETLNLSFNVLQALYSNDFHGLENLKILGLKNATIYKIYNGTFASLSKLEFLNLENNLFFKKHPETLDDGLFNGLGNLRVLLLGGCSLTSLPQDGHPFRELVRLEHLGLERNKLVVLPSFGSLGSLKVVDLSENSLQPWQKRVFDQNLNLETVIVSGNKFTHLTEMMVQDFHNLKMLDLSNNPFTCDCSLSVPTEILTLTENQTVLCAFPESTSTLTVREFLGSDKYCLNLTLLVSSAVCLVVLVVTIFGVYYFRWHLKYWLFLTRLHLSRSRSIRSSQISGYSNYVYDAFVSYSNEDRNFVVRLVSMLENHPPFIKLCVYERDFEIGTVISENVLESVAKSRKTLLVISDSYAKSQWCRWESQIAEHHRLFLQNEDGKYADDSVILIKLGPVNESHLTPILRYLLKTRIYLPWNVEEKKQKVFWEKLREVLAPPKEINENTYL